MHKIDKATQMKAHTDGAILMLLISIAAVLFYLYIDAQPNPLGTWLAEDGPFQNAQAVLLAVAAGGLAVAAWRSPILRDGNSLFRYLPMVAWIALMVLFVGEEISWGQRILGLTTPDSGMFALNIQNEINLHNQPYLNRVKARMVESFVLIVGVVLPILALSPVAKRAIQFFAFPVVPWQYVSFFIAIWLVHSYRIYPHEEFGYSPREYSETLFALALAMFALHGARRPDSLFRAYPPYQ